MQTNSLVLYKNHAARVTKVGAKIDILTEERGQVSVRPKDIILLHAGPMTSLASLAPLEGDVEIAWELLAGEKTTLADLAELIYGDFTPQTAWAAWLLVADGLYFTGTPAEVTAVGAEELLAEQEKRAARAEEAAAWESLLARLQKALAGAELSIAVSDEAYVNELEAVAHQQEQQSRILAALDQPQSPEAAHALLLKLGIWDTAHNPHPIRQGVFLSQPQGSLEPLPDVPRTDLTHLVALAIDDEDSNDPDDAVSLEGERLWVHIADAAALVSPDTPADWEARARGANVYLPEGVIRMLPQEATHTLGLGLAPVSPALSVAIDLTPDGEIDHVQVISSIVRVRRLSYTVAETQLAEEPLHSLHRLAQQSMARRVANGAATIDLPEVKVRVTEKGQVTITPLLSLASRDLVREAMLIAGEGIARFAVEHQIPIPFASQSGPRNADEPVPDGLAGMYAWRRRFRPSQRKISPAAHTGLGLQMYCQATSPLRRYLDLVVHQQLRAFVQQTTLLDEQAVVQRIGATEAITGNLRRAGRLSDQHWTMVYLQQHPELQVEGIVVEKQGARYTVLIPHLGTEATIFPQRTLALNEPVTLACSEVDLPNLQARFQLIG